MFFTLAASCGVDSELFGTSDGGSAGASDPVGGASPVGGNNPVGGSSPVGGNSPVGGGGTGGNMMCTVSAAKVALRPLDIVIAPDRTGSMGGSKFAAQETQLINFVTQAWAEGTSVALTYHAAQNVGDLCLLAHYNPPALALTPIPSQAMTVGASLTMQFASGPSVIHPILEGSLQFATAQKTANPDHVVIAVFMMDTPPNFCDTNIANSLALAAGALGFNGVRTFTIGYEGADIDALNTVAAAGGTMQALDLTMPGAIGTLSDELSDIRSRVVPCTFALPATPMGVNFDADEVNLVYTPGGNMPSETIPRVSSANACSDTPGWHWDDAASPTELVMCSATCTAVKEDMTPAVEVEFGCPTVDG